MENLLECAICMEKYNTTNKIPRILTCGHTFCSSCLEIICERSGIESSGISCPLDKTKGHQNKNVSEIPINRLIVDIIDMNVEKSKKQKEEKSQLTYIKTAKEKLKKITNTYTTSVDKLKKNLNMLINAKNKCLDDIINYYDSILSRFLDKKNSLLNYVNNYSNDKITFYSELLKHLEQMAQLGSNGLKKIEMLTKGKKAISISEEVNFVSSLGFETLEDSTFLKNLSFALNEIKSGICPEVIYDKEDLSIAEHIDKVEQYIKINLGGEGKKINSISASLPNLKIDSLLKGKENENNNDSRLSLRNSLQSKDLLNISNSLSSIMISEQITKFLWFQQNSSNIFSSDMTKENINWEKEPNENNLVLPEMFRVAQISNTSALITGGIQNPKSLNTALIYTKGVFTQKQNMYNERRNHATIKIDDFIFVCGGIDSAGNPIASCEKFSLQFDKWIKISNMNCEKSHLSLCNVNNMHIYSFGGENKYDSILDIIERYTILNDVWDIMPIKLPIKIECPACVKKSDHSLYIMGGFSALYGALDVVIELDLFEMKMGVEDKKLDKAGWSVYTPLQIEGDNSDVFVYFGGEENIPPNVVKYQIRNEL